LRSLCLLFELLWILRRMWKQERRLLISQEMGPKVAWKVHQPGRMLEDQIGFTHECTYVSSYSIT
jgi:hypothetical protein